MDSTFKPALLLMSGRALGFAVSFCIPVVLVRIFDQAEFGTYKQLFLLYSTLYGIAQLGMAESLFYFLPLAPREGGRYTLNSLLVLAGAGVACFALLGTTGSSISHGVNNSELSRHIPLIGIYLLLMLASAVLEIVMISRKRHLWASLSYGVSDLLRTVFFVTPALLLRQLDWLLLGAVAFASLRFCGALFYLRREFDGELRPNATLLKKQLAYTIPFGIAGLVEMLQSSFHQYAVSYHFDPATFAIYSVGCLQIPLVDFVFTPAGNVMMVRMSEKIRDGRSEAVLAIWHDTTRKLALIFFPLVGLLLVNAREIIVFLFTESYLASVPIFTIWSTAILFSVLQTDGVMRVYAQTRFLLVLNTIRLLLIVALIHWSLSTFQLLGAVIVTALATFVGKGLALARMKTLMQIGFSRLLPWRSLAAILAVAAAAGLSALLVKSELEIATLPLLLTTSLIYIATYITLLLQLGLLTEGERFAVRDWLQRLPTGAAKVGRGSQCLP